MTKQRGALRHDDRIDVLAIAVNYWVEQMASDAVELMNDRKADMLGIELEKFMNGMNTKPMNNNRFHKWTL
jgi:hypothetical protein